MKKGQEKRGAGIVISVSSVPSECGIGNLGSGWKEVIDWMNNAGLHKVSILPANPTSFGNSPYQSTSAFAGNLNYISPELLAEEGLLKWEEVRERGWPADQVDYGGLFEYRPKLMEKAYVRFAGKGGLTDEEYLNFCSNSQYWLDDYGEYMAIKETRGHRPWQQWPEFLANRREPEYSAYVAQLRERVEFWKFIQFVFFDQWSKARRYAEEKGIEIIGDMPFYVSPDSADVWSRRELFQVNSATGRVEIFAGVPADQFTQADRNWGNPVYRWEYHEKTDFEWIRNRIRVCGEMYHGLRIDHAIAMMRYFGIREGEEKGRWYDGPEAKSRRLSDAICQEAEKAEMFIIAEDLGQVPEGFRDRLAENGWDGMRVLEFAFKGKYGAKSNHLPFYHRQDMVVYTGTHDNPTLKEFLAQSTDEELGYIKWWTGKDTREELRWALIEEAYKSPANLILIPIQDILGLGQEGRMVFSDDYERSWKWRISDKSMLTKELAARLKRLAVLTGRWETKEEEEFAWYLESRDDGEGACG